jgi:hypothetical protein
VFDPGRHRKRQHHKINSDGESDKENLPTSLAYLARKAKRPRKGKEHKAIDLLRNAIDLSEKAINLAQETASISREAASLLQDAIGLVGEH